MAPAPTTPPASIVGGALREAKRAARERALAARDALPEPVRAAASLRIADGITSLASFAAARTVLVTLPFRSEWDTRVVARRALAAGKVVASPRVDAVARMLTLHRIADLARDVEPGYRGIPEPRPECSGVEPATIDWVLVPGVAFDGAGRRLGYGGGYYDRLLPLLAAGVPRVAGAFDVQVVPDVPCGPHDLVVDCVVTETRLVVPDGAARR